MDPQRSSQPNWCSNVVSESFIDRTEAPFGYGVLERRVRRVLAAYLSISHDFEIPRLSTPFYGPTPTNFITPTVINDKIRKMRSPEDANVLFPTLWLAMDYESKFYGEEVSVCALDKRTVAFTTRCVVMDRLYMVHIQGIRQRDEKCQWLPFDIMQECDKQIAAGPNWTGRDILCSVATRYLSTRTAMSFARLVGSLFRIRVITTADLLSASVELITVIEHSGVATMLHYLLLNAFHGELKNDSMLFDTIIASLEAKLVSMHDWSPEVRAMEEKIIAICNRV